jgi:hypothetical protein
LEVFDEKPKNVGPGSQIEEMAKGKTAHISIEEVKGQGENAENHEVRDPVERDQRNQNEKTDPDDQNFQSRPHLFGENPEDHFPVNTDGSKISIV